MSPRPWLLIVMTSLAMFVVMAGGTFAYASCGDWLAHADPPHDAEQSVGVQDSHQSPLALWLDDDRELESDAPCNGPNCRRGTPLPRFPQFPPPIVSVIDVAIVFSSSETRMFEPRDSFAAEIEGRPERGYPTRIEHPPRA